MKQIIILLSLIATVNSCNHKNHGRDRINDFIVNAILNDSASDEVVYSYLKIDIENPDDKLMEIIGINVAYLRQAIDGCESEYQIVDQTDVNDGLIVNYKGAYTSYDQVYYIMCNKEIITPIILKEGEIISFFTTLRKTKTQQINPWLLE